MPKWKKRIKGGKKQQLKGGGMLSDFKKIQAPSVNRNFLFNICRINKPKNKQVVKENDTFLLPKKDF
ncbi:MAG: hypothetical protein AAFZ15_15430 [Bacteroidota bacterium]